MQKSRCQDLIPDSVYSNRLVINSEQDLIYLGQESLSYLRDDWKSQETFYREKAAQHESTFDKMELINEAQECSKRASILDNLNLRAESKPSIFRELTTALGSRLMCCLPETNGSYSECILMNVSKDENGEIVYQVRPINKHSKVNRSIQFHPTTSTVIPAEDWSYLKCHQNFFRLYLYINADFSHGEEEIERIVASVV